jgi:aspartyl-tRNA(Asn)/glutamyl-tRNA(Gln) amidotransferase subunit A
VQGAVLVDDPFRGSGFADLRQPLHMSRSGDYDARGLESVPYDLNNYLERLGPDASLKSFAQFAAATAKEDPFAGGGVLDYMPHMPGFAACLADPAAPPDMSGFATAREAHLRIFNAVFAEKQLDALIVPQMRRALGARDGGDSIHETTVNEINIAGLPGVVVPAGYHEGGAPFCLIVVGPKWSEASLLGLAHAYEQATKHRKAPSLTRR